MNNHTVIESGMFEDMIKYARDIVFLVNPDTGDILYANEEAVRTYGYTRTQFDMLKIFDLRPHDSNEVIMQQIRTAFDVNEGILFEAIHITRDGKDFPVEINSRRISFNSTDVLLSIVRDISDHKQQLLELKFIENRLFKLYQAMSDSLALFEMTKDCDNQPPFLKFVAANQCLERVLGIDTEDITGHSAAILLPDLSDILLQQADLTLKTNTLQKSTCYSKALNKHFDIKTYSPGRNLVAVLFTDITELKNNEYELHDKYDELSTLYEELSATEEELKENYKQMEQLKENADAANKYKSRFIANMSHELRTPLNGMIGLLQLLSTTKLDTEQQEYCRIIRNTSEHLKSIVNNILDLSTIESGNLPINETRFRLGSCLEKILQIFEGQAKEKNVMLRMYVQPSVEEYYYGDELKLSQILINLVGNAVKFTENGRILIRVGISGSIEGKSKLLFSVEDSGIGVDDCNGSSLFDEFNQYNHSASASRKITTETEGTGLGLSICREMVRLLGGEIWYESTLGKGSTFSFTLAMKPYSEAPLRNVIASVNDDDVEISNEKHCILVAEDNEVNQIVVCRYLDLKGYNHICVPNGKKVLEAFERRSFDAVLMDLNMPEMDGFEASKRIRSAEVGSGKRTPIIAMTAYAMGNERRLCAEAGMDDFIPKPLNIEELHKKLQNWLYSDNSFNRFQM